MTISEDLERIFEALADSYLEGIDRIPESERAEYLAAASAVRLYKLKRMSAPMEIIEAEKRILQRRVSELPVYRH